MSAPTTSIVSLSDDVPRVTVVLPKSLKKLSEKILTIDQISCISTYCENTSGNIDYDLAFDSGEFTGITFYKLSKDKYSVWALHDSLECGPEFHINKDRSKTEEKLLVIVTDYLDTHKELGLNINQFM